MVRARSLIVWILPEVQHLARKIDGLRGPTRIHRGSEGRIEQRGNTRKEDPSDALLNMIPVRAPAGQAGLAQDRLAYPTDFVLVEDELPPVSSTAIRDALQQFPSGSPLPADAALQLQQWTFPSVIRYLHSNSTNKLFK
jgi:hypothetical protein